MSTQPLVLVADDEPRITELVSIALGEEGFRVITAAVGEDALHKAEEYRPDVVLLDSEAPTSGPASAAAPDPVPLGQVVEPQG